MSDAEDAGLARELERAQRLIQSLLRQIAQMAADHAMQAAAREAQEQIAQAATDQATHPRS